MDPKCYMELKKFTESKHIDDNSKIEVAIRESALSPLKYYKLALINGNLCAIDSKYKGDVQGNFGTIGDIKYAIDRSEGHHRRGIPTIYSINFLPLMKIEIAYIKDDSIYKTYEIANFKYTNKTVYLDVAS